MIMSGLSPNSVPMEITTGILSKQKPDGGWVGIVDTLWNCRFLELMNKDQYSREIDGALKFIMDQRNSEGLWGRSKRDMSRIPVTGILFYLWPDLFSRNDFRNLELLWESELNSIVYKAGYTLMAFKAGDYIPENKTLIKDTCRFLGENQRKSGGYAPWLDHPVTEDVFCTSIAALGLSQYPEYTEKSILREAASWLITNRLPSGIWKYHEIEDGASWGLFAMAELNKSW